VAEQISVQEGRTSWNASIQSDQIKGIMTWFRKDGTTMNYEFEGQRAPSG
jgi:hypothetical protein